MIQARAWMRPSMRTSLLLAAACAAGAGCASAASGPVSPWEAIQHVSRYRAVCGTVADTRYLALEGHTTYLYFERPHPDHPFEVVISGRIRSSFVERPERLYLDETICVRGIISLSGTARIVVTDRGQISIP